MRVRQVAVWAFVFGQFLAVQASAQSAAFNSAAMSAACKSGPIPCMQQLILQEQALRAAGLDEAALNEQFGLMAAVIVDAIQGASPDVAADYAGLLDRLADSTTDATQAAAIRAIGEQLEQGIVPTVSAVAESLGPISDN